MTQRLQKASNAAVGFLLRRRIPLFGARWLEVRGRKSGRWFGVPVNPLNFDDAWWLVAPRGETQWVRNLRVAGEGRLAGRPFQVVAEVPTGERPPVLSAYLAKWQWLVKDWLNQTSDPADHPVFRIELR